MHKGMVRLYLTKTGGAKETVHGPVDGPVLSVLSVVFLVASSSASAKQFKALKSTFAKSLLALQDLVASI
jgi:hypothetical protein